jgi:hypothetical protein
LPQILERDPEERPMKHEKQFFGKLILKKERKPNKSERKRNEELKMEMGKGKRDKGTQTTTSCTKEGKDILNNLF